MSSNEQYTRIQIRKQAKELINKGLYIINQMYPLTSNTLAGPNTRKLINVVNSLFPLIQNEHPKISDILSNAGKRLIENKIINAFYFGDTRTSLIILKQLYDKPRKIFISHSSKDKKYIVEFVDHILQLGIKIDTEDIFCTSIEDMDIRNGEDIRNHIKDNILSSDFSFLMISENYKASEICLNEMGAVWVNNNSIRYYVLPQTNFDKIGWLCDTKKAEQITDRTALDGLHEELVSYYDLENRYDKWSRQRETFINNIENIESKNKGNEKNKEITDATTNQSNASERIIELLRKRDNLSVYEIADTLGLSQQTATKCLSQLLDDNKVIKNGPARMTKWAVVSE